jgi:hypothetical protein
MENRNLGVLPKKVDPGFIFLKKELEIFTLYGTQIGKEDFGVRPQHSTR